MFSHEGKDTEMYCISANSTVKSSEILSLAQSHFSQTLTKKVSSTAVTEFLLDPLTMTKSTFVLRLFSHLQL